MIKIDQKDRELLFHMSLHARSSLKELSKKTGLSKEVVYYRLKNLEKKKIIEGYYAVINPYKIGLTFYRVYLKTNDMNDDVEKQFIDYLQKHPKISWIVEVDGDLDFLYVIWSKDISGFEEVYNDINEKFGRYTAKKFFSVMTRVYYFKNKYLLQREDDTSKIIGGKIENNKTDILDMHLIRLLSKNGRLSYLGIAKKLKTTAKTVQRKVKMLEKNGIITGYNVKINHKLLGYTQRKVMLTLNDTSKKMKNKLISFLNYHSQTIYVTDAIGQYDLEFEMMELSHEDFHKILRDIKNKFPGLVKEYFTVILYNEPKVGQL